MRQYLRLWAGQLISLVGSGVSTFALGVWVYEQHRSPSEFALVVLLTTLPGFIVTPFAGVMVDRHERRNVMLLADFGAAASMGLLAMLVLGGRLAVWHVYVVVALNASFSAVQTLAQSSTVVLLVADADLERAGGLGQLARMLGALAGPALGALLYASWGVMGVIVLDLGTFVFAAGMLLGLRIPPPKPVEQKGQESGSSQLVDNLLFGWRYLARRKDMLALLLFVAVSQFVQNMFIVLGTPYMLEAISVEQVGLVAMLGGIGMIIAGLIIARRGGFRRRVNGMLWAEVAGGLSMLVMGLWPGYGMFIVASMLFSARVPPGAGAREALWQSRVEAGLQGRVFAARRVVEVGMRSLALASAGPLAEFVFNPLLVDGGKLATGLGAWFGTGAVRGTGLLFALLGLGQFVVVAVACRHRPLRELEQVST